MSLRHLITASILVCLFAIAAWPQDQKTENPPEPEAHGTRLHWQDIPRNVLHDQKAIFTSPFRINRENAKWWALFGGGTAALISADQKITNHLPQTTALTTPSRWASRVGADYFIFPAWASFYFVGKVGDNPRARDTGRIGIEALIDAEIAVNALKFATQRPRPEIKGESVGSSKVATLLPIGTLDQVVGTGSSSGARISAPKNYSDSRLHRRLGRECLPFWWTPAFRIGCAGRRRDGFLHWRFCVSASPRTDGEMIRRPACF